jgi:hypothetical protein
MSFRSCKSHFRFEWLLSIQQYHRCRFYIASQLTVVVVSEIYRRGLVHKCDTMLDTISFSFVFERGRFDSAVPTRPKTAAGLTWAHLVMY